MIPAEIDPTVGIIIVALIGFLQAITLIYVQRSRADTKQIRKETQPNDGESMHDSISHIKNTMFAINRRLRMGERLQNDRHQQNKRRFIQIEEVLGIEDHGNEPEIREDL